MAINRKLTGVIKGRTIASADSQDSLLTITFSDGSTMTVKTPDTSFSSLIGTIQSVWQQGTTLTLELDSGETFDIQTQEETSSVMVRDANHSFEYSD